MSSPVHFTFLDGLLHLNEIFVAVKLIIVFVEKNRALTLDLFPVVFIDCR